MNMLEAVRKNNSRLTRILLVVAGSALLALLVVAGCGGAAEAPTNTSGSSSGAPSPSTVLADPGDPLAPTGKPKIVDLGSNSCLPCRMMEPELEELAQEYAGAVDVVVVDVDKEPELAVKLGIRVIPTQIFLSPDGKILTRHEGFLAKEDIVYIFTKFGYPLTKVNDNSATSD